MFHSIMEPHQQPPSSHQIPANGFPPRKRSFEQFSNWNPINTNDFSNNTPSLMNSPPSSALHLHNNLSPNNNNNSSNNGNPRFSHHFDHHKNRFKNNFTPAPNAFHNNDAPHQPPRKKFIPNGVAPSPLTQLLPAQHQYFQQQNHQLQHNNSQPQHQPQSFGSSQQPYLSHNNSSHMNTPPTIPSSSTVTHPVSNLSSPTLSHNPSVTNLTHNSNSSLSNNNPSNSIPNLNLPSPSPTISSPPGPVTLASLGHSVSLENLHKFNSDSSTLVKTISSSGPLGSIDHKSLFAKKLPVESKPNHNDLRRKHEEEYKMKQEKRKAEQMASSRLAHYATQDSHFWNFVIPTIPLFDDPNTNSPNSTSNSEMQT